PQAAGLGGRSGVERGRRDYVMPRIEVGGPLRPFAQGDGLAKPGARGLRGLGVRRNPGLGGYGLWVAALTGALLICRHTTSAGLSQRRLRREAGVTGRESLLMES